MPAAASADEFLDMIRKSGVADEKRLDAYMERMRASGDFPREMAKLAGCLVRDGLLTNFQAENILQGRWRRFTIGKYKVLERIGSGGMGQVYLCEHKLMRRRVAIKVLPTAKSEDEAARSRFYREARAVAALDHPNIVHAYDIDQDDKLHFLVMEYVDGANLQEIIKKTGPMDLTRACHYMSQAALGLDHAHQSGLIHRDIKPGNILIDRTGVVKILDMGLARFFNDEDDILTKKFDENVLGTADYLAPEQALDSHSVDVRADIYSLGATFYFLVTGRTPFGEGSVAQKLLWHANRMPKPIVELRKDVPPELAAIIFKMMSKLPADRFQTPGEIAEALADFTRTPIPPPPEAEMPQLSLAATGYVTPDSVTSLSKHAHGSKQAQSSRPPQPRAPASACTASASSTLRDAAVSQPTPNPVSGAPAALPITATPAALAPVSVIPAPNTVAGRSAVKAGAAEGLPVATAILPGPAPAPSPAEDVLSPWEAFAVDTADLSGKSITPHSITPHSIRLAASSANADQFAQKRRFWLAAIALTGAFLLVLFFLVWKFVAGQPAVPLREARPILVVSKNASQPNQFRSIQAALRSAQPGDVIQLSDDVHEENLMVEPTSGATEVTVQAAPGKDVLWKSAKQDEARPILFLSKAQGFKLKGQGITLDGDLGGGKRVKDLVFIAFYSPGLTLDDLQLKNFAEAGVHVMNAAGDALRPIRLHHVCGTTQKATAGVLLDVSANITSPPFNDHVEIDDACRFEGMPPTDAFKRKDNTATGSNVKMPSGK